MPHDHHLTLVDATPMPTADEVWLAALRAAGRSPHTLASYSHAVRNLREWLSERSIAAVGKWLRHRGSGPGSLWAVADPFSLTRATVAKHSHGQLTPTRSAPGLRRSCAAPGRYPDLVDEAVWKEQPSDADEILASGRRLNRPRRVPQDHGLSAGPQL